ncbi:hypothetical protein ABB37_01296 [Leptomonas pyrrhocoris]|uniref:Uncharacterized protein n=1 Tax=Leptomonas pyrrhocoris TaxID=157538 RepID=A0A0M9G8R8_LEPPY|nr:hypothetical protein ABB37_01296 [Leptomonas pyrrhocoris]XP_015663258.1 hypothetical protein ABB37_01296 [Leptomonas pyrrhocoris]KPA84818.1 hypothetical protein ABB37_01296 [Leptomonas pyrrhocoris]KPA84819.1 hypothetical protein ABB37_01296 [Leptomonas pyrrhocoris]|eukprot:XP_015663257.1 hypothetical protein ABB37_01296 [Leptomonas pyrrhocoris]
MPLRQRQGGVHDTPVASPEPSSAAKSSSNPPSLADTTAATHHESVLRRAAPVFLLNASLAGVCGALSGVVGKLAVESARVPSLVRAGAAFLQLDAQTTETVQAVVPWLLRLLFFLLNAVLTGSMWRFYLKALSQGPTPVCQILNTGTNFVVSAFAGLVFFAEEVTPMWGVGALLIVLGLALVVSDAQVTV